MNNFFINFVIQGMSKILGLKKKYDILNLLGTTALGDIYKLSYNWPHLFKRILVDGTLSFVITPYLLEGNHISLEEFQKRNNELINSFIILLIVLIIIFFISIPWIIKDIPYGHIDYVYKKFFLLIIPMAFILIFNCIIEAKGYFIYSNMGQIINNIVFIILIGLYNTDPLHNLWQWFMVGFIIHSLYILYIIIKNNYVQFSFSFLPLYIIIDMIKCGLFQFCNRLNHIIANILGYRFLNNSQELMTNNSSQFKPGVLMATDFSDNITTSIIGIFAMTVAIIMTPKFYQYFALKNEKYRIYCQKIIIGAGIVTIFLGGFIFLNSYSIVFFLFSHKANINNLLLSSMLKWTSGQIFLLSLIKIIQRILTIEKLLNKSLIIAFSSSLLSSVLEIYLYPIYGIYGFVFSQYCFIIIELISIIYVLNNNNQWRSLWKNIDINIGLVLIKIIGLLSISKIINYKIFSHGFHIKFLFLNGIWGVLSLIVLWPYIKFFIIKDDDNNL